MSQQHHINPNHNMKSFVFYNTFITRQDIINLNEIHSSVEIEKYFIETVQNRFEKKHKANAYQREKNTAFSLISFEYTLNHSVSQATQDSQNQCKNAIISEFLMNIFEYCKRKFMNYEQISTILSISFFIFSESLENKMTQIDSYELFKKILKAQISLTNTSYLPLFNRDQIMGFNYFIVDIFYQYYSLYELRMTIYQEVNIYSRIKSQDVMDMMIQEQSDSEFFDENDDADMNSQQQDGEKIHCKEQSIYLMKDEEERKISEAEIEAEKIIDIQLDSLLQRFENKIKEQDAKINQYSQEVAIKKK